LNEAIKELCKREYKLTVDTKISGRTVAVYLPIENLFDAVLNIDSKASKKLNDVILGVSRVAISTDGKFDFYIVITQDPKMPEVEIVYIRYVDDIKRFLLGGISRDDYSKRAVIAIKTPPQAERERILKDLFSKLKVENSDQMIKEYLESEEGVSGIGDISYWNNKFFIKEIGLAEFLASQIEERIKMDFRTDKDLNKWYELKSCDGKFVKSESENHFVFNINIANRVEPLYLDSGVELDAYKKRIAVFKSSVGIAGKILSAYKFDDFNRVDIVTPTHRIRVSKDKLWKVKSGKIKIEELI
jgi:hypothetical protein